MVAAELRVPGWRIRLAHRIGRRPELEQDKAREPGRQPGASAGPTLDLRQAQSGQHGKRQHYYDIEPA